MKVDIDVVFPCLTRDYQIRKKDICYTEIYQALKEMFQRYFIALITQIDKNYNILILTFFNFT